MLESLAAWVLNTYVGEYVENLNTDQLSIALLQGAVELDNLPLKKTALKSLGLPLQVNSGFIGKIKLVIPVRRLHSEPWVISVERLYLVAGPLQDVVYDEEKEKAAEAARKAKLLEALEAKLQLQKTEKQESSWFSYGASVLSNILDNLQLNIRDVHIRYEDDVTNPQCPFAFGVVIKDLSAQSTDAGWLPKFVSQDNVALMHKLVDLQNFALYFDTNTTLVGNLPKDKMAYSLQRDGYVSSITDLVKYQVLPKMKRYTTLLPLQKIDCPRNTIDLNLESMVFSLSDQQYRNMVLLVREFEKHEKSKRYKKWRPKCSVKNNTVAWWKFAIQAKLSDIQEKNRRCSKMFMVNRARDVVSYTKLYTSQLKKESISANLKVEQCRIEGELCFEEIKTLRELVFRRLKHKGMLSKTPSGEPEPSIKRIASPQEQQSVLQRWFPGWAGWYGGASCKLDETKITSTDENVGEPPPKISKSELEQEIHDVLGDGGDDDRSVLKRDAVFAKLNFCLTSGAFKLFASKTEPESGDRVTYSILELECSTIQMMFESRPRTSGLSFGLGVEGLQLFDKMTENSHFPCLVGFQNKDRFGSKRQMSMPGSMKYTNMTTVMEDSDFKLFNLMYEKNPFGMSANYRFVIHTQPVDIVYNKQALQKLTEVFSSKNIPSQAPRKSESTFSAAARRQYELLKRQTQAEFKNSLRQLFDGSEKIKKWEIKLDIAAPQIIIPENFVNENTSLVVLDLGHLKLHNKKTSTPENHVASTYEDEFLTPLSTPPSELRDRGAQKTVDFLQLSKNDLSEIELANILYDKYVLELTDLQVMIGKTKDNWRYQKNSPLHLVDKFTISVELERRTLYTTDPRWPAIIVSGKLPSLVVHVNEYKVQTLNACIQSLSVSPTLGHSLSESGNFQLLADSSSGLNLPHIDEIAAEDSVTSVSSDKLMEEETQLLNMKFSIEKLSLEIHSRGRPVAELQVSGVGTSLIKCPYDLKVKLTVQSLLVVDALQNYGPDFELLVASHKNVTLDNISGSIRDSGTTSPMIISPKSPPGSPIELLQPNTSSGFQQSVQDIVTSAYQTLLNIGEQAPKDSKSDHCDDDKISEADSEALIILEFEMIAVDSPSNIDREEGPLIVANLTFNNLDIIANQETIVEIMSFLKRTTNQPGSFRTPFQAQSNTSTSSQSTFAVIGSQQEQNSKIEVTAEFNRFSVMMMRLENAHEKVTARKVAIATMSCARLQATIDAQLSMTGSLGGFHVFDITPEVKRHCRVFSVGHEAPQSIEAKDISELYKTVDQSMLMDALDPEKKAFSFTFSKPLRKLSKSYHHLNSSDAVDGVDTINVSLNVASLCYIHSPRMAFELSQCVSEFKEYKVSVTSSLKTVANEVAKGMIAKRSDLSQTSLFGSSSSIEKIKCKSNQTLDKTEMEYLQSITFNETVVQVQSKIVLDAWFDSPIIVIPKSASSPHVLMAHLGQISLSNRDDKGRDISYEDFQSSDLGNKSENIFIDVHNINLYAVDIDKIAPHEKSDLESDNSIDFRSLNMCTVAGTPIMYDTNIEVIVNHTTTSTSVTHMDLTQDFIEQFHPTDINDSFMLPDSQTLLDMKAKIRTPLKVVLVKSVYEQILQTSDYLTSFNENDQNVNQNSVSAGDYVIDTSSRKSFLNSSKYSVLQQTQVKDTFVTKKLRFEVPVFSVELRGDFGDDEHGIVELKLNRFLMDYLKDTPAVTKVELSLKSVVMEDLLESPDSPHRQIMVSNASQKDEFSEKPREFLSQSCPDPAIVVPIPMMPHSLPNSFYDLTTINQPILSRPLTGPFMSAFQTGKGKPQRYDVVTPPPSPRMTHSHSHNELLEENLVHISIMLVDKAFPEYTEKYNETKRFVDVDFNCLHTKINLQTWVVLLDFLGLGSKVHDIDTLAGRVDLKRTVDPEAYVQPVVNSQINIKVEKLTINLNKQEYQFAEASVSKLISHMNLRDGNLHFQGSVGNLSVLDLSPSSKLFKERFMTVGEQAIEFDFFKFGVPDPYLKRDYDMQVMLRMSSVRYTHTNKFYAEMLGFIQHFLQLQDVLGRMRAAADGKKINEAAFHGARILMDIEAGSPIILIPHSTFSTDVLVVDLGKLSVKNCFRFDGDEGTFRAPKEVQNESASDKHCMRSPLQGPSMQMSKKTGIITSRSTSRTDAAGIDELMSARGNSNPMTDSTYGGLDSDIRSHSLNRFLSEGSSTDPESLRSESGLNITVSDVQKANSFIRNPTTSSGTCMANRTVFADNKSSDDNDSTMETSEHKCLLDILDVRLSEMDLFAAERVEKRNYKGLNQQQDLEYPSCVIRQGCKLLKEKCMLNLTVERNLEGEISHAVPDISVQGSLSSVHCCLDTTQYKLIIGLIDHNLGEKFENFKKDLMTHMQDPKIQTVLSGDVFTVISMAIDLHNVTLELLTSHELDSYHPEVSLAKLDFIHSRLTLKLFSDQSKETDLVSHEILASDTRYRDVTINQRPSVFEKILQQTKNANPDSLQAELHYRMSLVGKKLTVILNNMKLMCSFDWIIAVKEFIGTKPALQTVTADSDDRTTPTISSGRASQTSSPLTTSGGIITKRGPIVEQVEVPFELKLNVKDTEFVVVENLASVNTNAVILKCTSELSYRPKSPDKLLTCNLQSLEVFSCSLQAEEDTALSIVDPMAITIELNANPLPLHITDATAGLFDAKLVDREQLHLEVDSNTINLRLSYQDMQMFLAIMDSLPKQALKSKTSKSPAFEFTDVQIEHLLEMGYSKEDSILSLKAVKGNVDKAVEWLEKHKRHKNERKITSVKVNIQNFCVCLIDDCQDADVPLVELNFREMKFLYESGSEGKADFKIIGDYYNRTLSGWESLIEPWSCQAQWKHYNIPEKKLAVEISAPKVLNISITSTLLDLYNKTRDKWTADYYKQNNSSHKEMESLSGVKRRQLFTPYKIRNHTGSSIYFKTVITNPFHVDTDIEKYQSQNKDAQMNMEWLCVPPNDEMAFHFHKDGKIRFKKFDSVRVNWLTVQVDGWDELSPLSVDKVGTYFRYTKPDVNKPSIFKVNEHQQARVVFDIQQEGSAMKVITLRSALMVVNKLDSPIEVRVEHPVIPKRYELLSINSNQQKPIPMAFVASRLWVRSNYWGANHSDQLIQWQHIKKPGEIEASISSCTLPDNMDVFRFCMAVRRENYPEEPTGSGLHPLPGHSIVILPLILVVNLLPVDLPFYFKDTKIKGTIKPGKEEHIHTVNVGNDLDFGIQLENFVRCNNISIPAALRSRHKKYIVKMNLYDIEQRLLQINVAIQTVMDISLKLEVSAPFWLVNKSGLPVVFQQEAAGVMAAGQFEVHEMARVVSPLLFSFTEREVSELCQMRVGRHTHGPFSIPQWCKGFPLNRAAGVAQLSVTPPERNRPDWVYNIGIEVKKGQGQFRCTTIVTFSPRYYIDNLSRHKLAISQRHFTNKEKAYNPDGHLTALPNCKMAFHWPRQDLDQLLCVKLWDVEDSYWSGGFKIDAVTSFHLNMRDARKNSLLLKVEVLQQGQTYYVIFTDAEETPPPFRIDNMSKVSVQYYQAHTQEEHLRAYIRPQTSLKYAWDEPTLDHSLTLSVYYGNSKTYNLDNLGEGDNLYYHHYYYICAACTVPRNGTGSGHSNENLVLECDHDHIVFRRKEAGKRSQLWQMTESGILEHVGMGHPFDPSQSSAAKSGPRYVLDIADIALQPERPVPLTLKKADERRAAKQTWRFKDGMLFCSIGNFCVQALNGEEGLQNGAMVFLGPGPTGCSPVPAHMQMTLQKLQPGSGTLTVRIIMHGPIRVVQINDIKQRRMCKTTDAENNDWEIYEESQNHKANEKRKKPLQSNIELDLNLKGGLGVSIVSNMPEELLYITLKNITLSYRANKRSVTWEINIANIQADNQLFNASHAVLLFVTPPSKRDVVENTPALLISACKLSDTGWNFEVFKHLVISMKKMTVHLEEELLFKVMLFLGVGQSVTSFQSLQEDSDDLQKTLSNVVSLKKKLYYFGLLQIKETTITLSMLQAPGTLQPSLARLKKDIGLTLVNFEDAKVELRRFTRSYQPETKEFYINDIKKHFIEELKGQAVKILGSADILGNPLGLFNDVAEGLSGLIEDNNIGGLAKGIFHGVSNTTAKMTGAVSESISIVHMDSKHNSKRQQIRNSATTSGGQVMSGIVGLGHGLVGGLKSVFKPVERGIQGGMDGGIQGGLGGVMFGLYEGVTGLVTKPVAGVLDFASGMSNAVREVSRRTSNMQPERVRAPRCCHGPAGLLRPYSDSLAASQVQMYKLNDYNYDEIFIASSKVRQGKNDCMNVMITNKQVFVLSSDIPQKEHIIINVKHEQAQCRDTEKDGRHYVEITLNEDRSNNLSSSNKSFSIRCDTKEVAQQVVKQLKYAKDLFYEQKSSVPAIVDDNL